MRSCAKTGQAPARDLGMSVNPDLPITIVTPTLNAAQFLAECLESVKSQGWPAVEHLVVDGGSQDRTKQLALDSGAVWLARPRLNQSAAINVGLRPAPRQMFSFLHPAHPPPP